MPIDRDRVVGAQLTPSEATWDDDRVILYHLGLGAGADPTDPAELAYTYEGNLKVLPSYATIPAFGGLIELLTVPGLEVNPAMILHGEHEIALHRPVPRSATVMNRATVTDVFDKGKGATVVLETVSEDRDGTPLFTNRATVFVRGEGGFGGPSGPAPGHERPERDPDHVVESPTLPQQALLYRLSGDKNPLHADPAFAAFGGFDRPILHGLCTYGVVCKAAVEVALGGDVTAVAGYSARFRGPVFPGETIVTSVWDQGDRLVLAATTAERAEPVLSNAAIVKRTTEQEPT